MNSGGKIYDCLIPTPKEQKEEDQKDNFSIDLKPFFASLEGNCIYRNEGWWSYEFCFDQHIFQLHQDNQKVMIKIVLGKYAGKNSTLIPLPEMKYVSQKYNSGTLCDVENIVRETEIRFHCSPSSLHKFSLRSIEEPSTCTYVVNVDSLDLCKHPQFAVKEALPNFIYCSETQRIL